MKPPCTWPPPPNQYVRLTLVVPATPPSVNHYKRPILIRSRKTGKRHISFLRSDETMTFRDLVRVSAAGRTVAPQKKSEQRKCIYRLRAVITQEKDERGDWDNYLKVLGDSLQGCGVIHSDARIREGHVYLRRGESPSTEITVWRLR